MKGVILAAGKGSRLYPVTHHIPKPLLPLANRPTLHYAFDRLKEMGIREVCLVVGENEPLMREALGDGSAFDLQLEYVRQTEPKGLAHAVGFAREFVGEDPFALYLGDAIYSEGFAELAKRFLDSDCANLNLVQPVEDPKRFGVATVEEGRIVRLVEKPQEPESNLAMAGLYFFRAPIWDAIDGLEPSARGEYEITDAIQRLIDRGETVLAGEYAGAWFDTGTLDSFLATSRFLAGEQALIAPSARLEGTCGPGVVIGEGAEVRCRSIEDAVILPGARIEVEGEIRHAILGGRVSLPEAIGQIVQEPDATAV